MPLSTRVRADFLFSLTSRGSLRPGYGDLRLFVEGKPVFVIPSRTGSIGLDGMLKNHCPIGTRYLCNGPLEPAECERDLMLVEEDGKPWKQRLWPYPVHPDHEKIDGILIHPDGSKNDKNDKNGTSGCIGTLDNAEIWRLYMIGHFYDRNADVIPIEIGLIV